MVNYTKEQGLGFLDILGSVLKIGQAVGAAVGSGGASLAAEGPGAAAAIGSLAGSTAGAVPAAATVGSTIASVKRAADLGSSVMGGVGAAKNLVAPDDQTQSKAIESPAYKPLPSSQELLGQSQVLKDAISAAQSHPEGEQYLPDLTNAFAKNQRQQMLAMRRV